MKDMSLARALLVVVISSVALSCATTNQVVYFQDAAPAVPLKRAERKALRFKAEDRISILISTEDPLLDDLFNLSATVKNINGSNSDTKSERAYRVDSKGYIELPVLGSIKAEGMSRDELRDEISRRLKGRELVAEPLVVVDFADFGFTILGEVSDPGRHSIDRDHFTILDAIASAGDLTIYSKREGITVYRSEGEEVVPYRVDVTDLQSLYDSEAYYIEQNDVIYVEPTKVKARQASVNGNLFSSYSFWTGAFSLILSTILLFIAL